MPEILKVYKESLPSLRLIGKRYTNDDIGAEGDCAHKWKQWFENNWFSPLESIGYLPENGEAYLGCMRCCEDEFEYWIGIFTLKDSNVPEGYDYVDIPAGDIAVCWISGREDNGELYGEAAHNMSMERVKNAGYEVLENAWFFERYNCPRFTTPDSDGKVILDYCVYVNAN